MKATVLDAEKAGRSIYIVVAKGNHVKVGWSNDLYQARNQTQFPDLLPQEVEEIVIRVDM